MRFPGIGFRKSKGLWEITEKRRRRLLNTKISTNRRRASMRPVCGSFRRARSPGSNWIQAPLSNAMAPNGNCFPSWRSGLIFYADSVGQKCIVNRISDFEREHGPRWKIAPLLHKLVLTHGSYREWDKSVPFERPRAHASSLPGLASTRSGPPGASVCLPVWSHCKSNC